MTKVTELRQNVRPVVSIIVPCFNLGGYLRETIDSLLAQTFRGFEIIVVDDGSTEEATLQALATIDPTVARVVHSPNNGLSAARNLGVELADGEFVASVDADDLVEPTFLERSLAAFKADSNLTFVSHWLRTFGDDESEWTPTTCDLDTLLVRNTVNGAALVRREAVLAVGGFDETMLDGCEDWDLWLSLTERGYRGTIIPEFLYRYRRRSASMSQRMHEGDGFARIYARLAAKHGVSFCGRRSDWLVELELELGSLYGHVQDLAYEAGHWFDPEVVRRRETAASLEERLRLYDQQSEERAHLQRVEAAAAQMRSELAREKTRHAESARHAETLLAQAKREREEDAQRSDRRYAAAESAVLRLDAEANRLLEENTALRRSFSWRITGPLRLTATLLRRFRAE